MSDMDKEFERFKRNMLRMAKILDENIKLKMKADAMEAALVMAIEDPCHMPNIPREDTWPDMQKWLLERRAKEHDNETRSQT